MLVERNNKVDVSKWPIAPHVLSLETSVINEILKISSQPGVISFAGGLPAPNLFPLADLREAMNKSVEKYHSDCMQYSLSRGIIPLRQQLAARAVEQGAPTKVDNIIITSGAQQGLEVVARAFIDPGDYILTENPTYLGAMQAFNYYQARYVAVEMDDEGMLVDQVVAKIEKYQPKLIYTVAHFQNPTGITMSLKRRRALIEMAIRYDIPIVDDNPYSDIQFEGEPIPTLKALGGDAVIELNTFSKTVAPGLRIGWMNGAEQIMPQFEKVKQCTDLHSNTLCQYMIYEYIKAGKFEPHIETIKANYRNKRNIMLAAMRDFFPEEVKRTEPKGGLFLWVELPRQVSAKNLLPKAIESKVAYVYGTPFFPNQGGENCLRLNFSNASPEEIVEGIKRLGKLFKENI